MFKEAINNWRRDHYVALVAWGVETEASLNKIIREALSADEITNADFMSLIKVIMTAGNFTQTEFSQITALASGRISSWQQGYELPDQSLRRSVLELCYKSLGTKKAPTVLEQMVHVIDVTKPPADNSPKSITSESDVEFQAGPLGFDPWKHLEWFTLSTRLHSCLRSDNLKYLGQLVQVTESDLLSIGNFGQVSLREVEVFLQSENAFLGMKHPELDEFSERLAKGDIPPLPDL